MVPSTGRATAEYAPSLAAASARATTGASGAEPVGGRVAQNPGDAPEDLSKDHPRVAPGTHERSVGDCGAQRLEIVGDAVEALDDRLHGERHVGSGVAVRDWIDVEVVDHLTVVGEPSVEADDHAAQGGRVEIQAVPWHR